MTKYSFGGFTRTIMEFTSDELAIRAARYITDNANVKVAKFNGKYWESIN